VITIFDLSASSNVVNIAELLCVSVIVTGWVPGPKVPPAETACAAESPPIIS